MCARNVVVVGVEMVVWSGCPRVKGIRGGLFDDGGLNSGSQRRRGLLGYRKRFENGLPQMAKGGRTKLGAIHDSSRL